MDDARSESAEVLMGEGHKSLEGMHSSVAVPKSTAGFWRQYRAFAGPALLVSVGYMDPGNWATDLQGGAKFKYGLLWVVALSSMMAIVLQICSARLGVVRGGDRGEGEGPGGGGPGLVPAVEPVAELAGVRAGDHGVRPGGGAGERGGDQAAV